MSVIPEGVVPKGISVGLLNLGQRLPITGDVFYVRSSKVASRSQEFALLPHWYNTATTRYYYDMILYESSLTIIGSCDYHTGGLENQDSLQLSFTTSILYHQLPP